MFLIYINDLEKEPECKVSKFTDNTKIGGGAVSDKGTAILQQYIDGLINDRKKEFNMGKYKVIHFGKRNS